VEPEEEIEKVITKPMPGTAQIISDVFKVAELMGWGYGTYPQVVFKLPPGTTVESTIEVPDLEVWWVTFCIFGGIPSSSLLFGLSRQTKTAGQVETGVSIPSILIHEGLIGRPLCPPGWHRADYSITAKYENVTGNPKYNDLSEQELHVRHTFFVFKIYEKYVDNVEDMILKALEREAS